MTNFAGMLPPTPVSEVTITPAPAAPPTPPAPEPAGGRVASITTRTSEEIAALIDEIRAEGPQPPQAPPETPPEAQTTGERLTAALASLRWSQGLLATTLRLSPSTVRHWASGRARPPTELLLWLERLAAHHEADPMPVVTVRPGNPTWR